MTSKILKKSVLKDRGQDKPARRDVDAVPEGGVLDHRVISAAERAQKIIADAEAEAGKILAEAEAIKSRTEASRQEAQRQGFAKGEAQGKAVLLEKIAAVEKKRESFYESAEKEIIRLTIAIAEKVIGQIANERSDVVKDVVRQALERSLGDRIMVKLNPEDYKAITAEGCEFRDVIDRTKRIMFKEDDSIQKGGCIVETEVGTIDAQLETQMEAIKKALEI